MNITNFDSVTVMEQEALELLKAHFSFASERPHAVMLTGGRTPQGIYRQLQENPCPVNENLHLLISDERHVPLDSPDSNYGKIKPMVEALGIDESRVMRVDTDLDLDASAEDYDRRLGEFFESDGRITLGILGLGADGHLASLFNSEDVQRGKGRLAVAVPKTPGPNRVSVTRDLLLRVDKLVFLVAGSEKADVVEQIAADSREIVAAEVLSGAEAVSVWFSQ